MKKYTKAKMVLLGTVMSAAIFSSVPAQALVLTNAVYVGSVPFSEIRVINISTVSEAESYIKEMGSDAISFLGNKSLSKAEKEKKFEALLNKHFAMKTIGRFVAGPHWNGMNSQQQEEYQRLFNSLIVSIYSERFSDYDGQEFVVDSARPSGETDYIVSSYILALSGEKIPVKWHVRDKNGQQKIVDVKIKDVSMAISKKAEFSSIIQRGGGNPEVLLKHLRDKIG